jgi:hypothetical protein
MTCLDAKPFHSSVDSTSTNFNSGDLGTASNFCHHLQTFQQDLCLETTYIDTILHRLRQYYADVKSKCQLNLEVPAGFVNSHSIKRITMMSPLHRFFQHLPLRCLLLKIYL